MIPLQEVMETFLRSERVFLAVDETVYGPDVFLFLAYKDGTYIGFRLDDSRHCDRYFVSADDLSDADCRKFLQEHGTSCVAVEPDSIEVLWYHQLSTVIGEEKRLSSDPYAASIAGLDFKGRDGLTICLRNGTYPNSMRISTEKPCSPNG